MTDDRDPSDPRGMHPLLIEGILLSILGVVAMIVAYLVMRPAPSAGAPAPMVRPAKAVPFDPHKPTGAYRMLWGGGAWDLRLSAFGNYEARAGESVWVGSWHVDAAGTLWVSEAPVHDDGTVGEAWNWGASWGKASRENIADGSVSGDVVYTSGERRTTITLKRAK